MNARFANVLVALTLFSFAVPAHAFPGDMVIMQGLDKVTARVSTFEAPLGVTVRFGTLDRVFERRS